MGILGISTFNSYRKEVNISSWDRLFARIYGESSARSFWECAHNFERKSEILWQRPEIWREMQELEYISLSFTHMFLSFIDVVSLSILMFSDFLVRTIDWVTGIVIDRCRCRKELEVDELDRKLGEGCLAHSSAQVIITTWDHPVGLV